MLEVEFTKSLDKLIITSPRPIVLPSNVEEKNLCRQLFHPITIKRLGVAPICEVTHFGLAITVQLDLVAEI